MRASIRQVAQLAQVSPATASRVARGNRRLVNDETYERVLAAMQELNYVPVRTALQNHHVETNTIGVVPMHRKPSHTPIDSLTIEGLCSGAGEYGKDLLIMLRGEAEWMVNRHELQFLDRRSDGFIFISPGLGEWQFALETLVENNMPAVVCYRRDVPDDVAWVDPDNEGIIRLGLECLIGHGHSKIAYLAGPGADSISNEYLADVIAVRSVYDDLERRRHFTDLMTAAGLNAYSRCILQPVDARWQLSREGFAGILASGATAVICVSDYMAQQVLTLAREAGMSVPGDLSILGIDNEYEAPRLGVSTIAFGYDIVGRLAIDAWIELSQGKPAEECCKIARAQLIERSTTGPAS